MELYKRNQVEEAISRTFGEQSGKPSSHLKTRVKRLLDTDRGPRRKARSRDPGRANYAFYSGGRPGKGIEVWFSDYEAFALMTGLRLLEHGWPQSFVVRMLRHLRPELEREHARILKQRPTELFDQKEIMKNAKPGNLYVDNTDPVFLTVISRQGDPDGARRRSVLVTGAVCRGQEQLFAFLREQRASSSSLTELATPAHQLFSELSRVEPRKRGRGS
jgi:hypothetical protein